MASYENFSSFTRCSRRVFLCAYSELDDGKDGVGVLRALRCLRRSLITYFTSKSFSSRFYVFRSALFGLSVFYASWLYFQLLRKFFVVFYLSFFFGLGQGPSARDPIA